MWPLLVCAVTSGHFGHSQYLNETELENPGWSKFKDCHEADDGDSVYNYNFTTLDGSETISLDAYRYKTLLIVNVATY